MKKVFFVFFFLHIMRHSFSQTDYKTYPVYYEKDLGLTYSKEFSVFKIWAPTADAGELLFYKDGDGGELDHQQPGSAGRHREQIAQGAIRKFHAGQGPQQALLA